MKEFARYNKKILITLSGGLDSLYMLYKTLTGAKYSRHGILVHHVNIINSENRAKAEARAVKNILHYFRSQPDKYREFEYSESTIEVPHKEKRGMFDTDAVNFIAGYLCSIDPAITEVHTGVLLTDHDDGEGREIYLADRFRIGASILAAFAPSVKKVRPIEHITKAQALRELPGDLAKLSWSCRRPTYIDDIPIQCNECKTCKQLKEAMSETESN
jgi:hypothetical protein